MTIQFRNVRVSKALPRKFGSLATEAIESLPVANESPTTAAGPLPTGVKNGGLADGNCSEALRLNRYA